MKRTKRILPLAALLLTSSVSAFGQSVVPQSMNFQGRLAKPDGTPLADANYTLTVAVYDVGAGGNPLWMQTLSAATHYGIFSVVLGNGTTGANGTQTGPLNAALFGGSRWLQVQVNTNPVLTQRFPFESVAYAFRSTTAETALGVANGSITLNNFAQGVLNFSNIGGQITSSQIAPAFSIRRPGCSAATTAQIPPPISRHD